MTWSTADLTVSGQDGGSGTVGALVFVSRISCTSRRIVAAARTGIKVPAGVRLAGGYVTVYSGDCKFTTSTSPVYDQVVAAANDEYIAVQANDQDGDPLTTTSFVPLQIDLGDFTDGTEIRFLTPQEIDLNGNEIANDSILALQSDGPEYNDSNDVAFDTQYNLESGSADSFDDGTFNVESNTLTVYVQALQQGVAELEVQTGQAGDWTTLERVTFTALDTNVGSPSGVSVTPAGFLAVNEDPLGVGSSIFTTSADPGVVTFGLPAHLVLTGNGVAVIHNDQVDIWDWDNTGTSSSPNWVLVPRKPQEQGTMVYDQDSGAYVQTVNGTQYTFDAPDGDADSDPGPKADPQTGSDADDFGLLTSMVDPYGNETDYSYNQSGQLTSQIWTVGPEHTYTTAWIILRRSRWPTRTAGAT